MTDAEIAELRAQSVRAMAARNLRAEAIARSIAHRLGALGLDELRVVDNIVLRLQLGRERYGELDLSKPRDWAKEECEEHLDALVYRTCALLVERDAETYDCEDCGVPDHKHPYGDCMPFATKDGE